MAIGTIDEAISELDLTFDKSEVLKFPELPEHLELEDLKGPVDKGKAVPA